MLKILLVLLALSSAILALSSVPLPAAAAVNAKPFTVNSILDEPDSLSGDGKCNSIPSNVCTLRAAVMEARVLGGARTILLPADNTYQFTRAGNDDTSLNGDLDILGSVNLTIIGGDRDSTVIDANFLDRIFDVNAGASLTLMHLKLINGKALTGHGNATVTFDHVTFRDNDSNGGNGGAIQNQGTMIIRSTMFRENKGAGGGAISNTGTMYIERSSFYQNYAEGSGGAIENRTDLYITNSTFGQNESVDDGGGIWNDDTVVLASSTLSENIADAQILYSGDGGGLFNDTGGSFTVRNSIIAENNDKSGPQPAGQRPYNCAGSFTSQGYNLISIKTGCTGFANGVNGDKVGIVGFPVIPKLYDIEVNYASIAYRIMSDSPARNAGNSTGCTDAAQNTALATDQYNNARVSESVCDMGSYESNSDCVKPLAPTLYNPPDKYKTTLKKLWLDWLEPDCASKYHVQVRQDSPTGPKADGVKNLPLETRYQTKTLTPGRKYYWRVKACTSDNKCSKSEWRVFRIK